MATPGRQPQPHKTDRPEPLVERKLPEPTRTPPMPKVQPPKK